MTPADMRKVSTVLITGGTDGLGRAAAVLLAERGYGVFGTGRNAERRAALDALARCSTAFYPVFVADLTRSRRLGTAVRSPRFARPAPGNQEVWQVLPGHQASHFAFFVPYCANPPGLWKFA